MKLNIVFGLFLLALFNTIAVQAAGMKIEIIQLKHRNSDELIPVIKPLVSEGGTVTGINNQLVVKSTPGNLAQIKQLLKIIDIAARRLMITVKQDIDGNIDRTQQSVSAKYSSGNVTISNSGGRKTKKGVEISARDDEGNNIKYRTFSTRSNLEDKNTFQVQTMEGRPAFIESGQSVPVANQNVFVTNAGVVVHDTVEYRNVTSGFYVLPRLNGNNVTLLISPQLSRINPNQGAVFDVQNAETTVSGRLGEWISIGGVTQDFNVENKGTLYRTRERGQEMRSILLKVEEVH